MITDPRFAPRRGDLPYLRRRSRRRLHVAEPTGHPSGPPAGVGEPDIKVAEFFSGHRPARARSQPQAVPPAPQSVAAGPSGGPVPARAPATPQPAPTSSSLDLDASDAPTLSTPSRPSPAPVSSSLDLTAPAPTVTPVVPATSAAAQPRSGPSTSLDLDAEPARPAAAGPSRAPASASLASRARPYPVTRVVAGGRTILGRKVPTVTLTRTQSGIGTLSFEAACSDEVGDLRLGCAYHLRSGLSSTVQVTGGNRFAPPRSRRPVLVGGHDRYERISVDLRQCQEIDRLGLYAFSESRALLNWGGTLIVTTFSGAKIEIPLEELGAGGVAMLLSLYNVGGEFVLRAELETITGAIREACRAYGYDQITWLDDHTPVD